jgi:protein-tyrosine-phosphatase
MKELGYDLSAHGAKSLQDLSDVPYDAAVSMGCGDACPMANARIRKDWNIPDPKHLSPQEFRAVRDLIETRVKDLLRLI